MQARLGRPVTIDMSRERQIHRVFPVTGATCVVVVDGIRVSARAGQSVLSVLLARDVSVRVHELSGEPRAGFCLMGACQDCWVWFGDARRGRACTTPVEDGMTIFTRPPHVSARA
jgi:NADH dehydrogenase/NADH:ubiquinone oxidoreductase subunit G